MYCVNNKYSVHEVKCSNIHGAIKLIIQVLKLSNNANNNVIINQSSESVMS